jgi:selenocysteine lyase/cysteine desulfurase
MIERWTPEVGLALLTWVTSTASARCDLPALVAHGRAQGSVIGVDITQAAGLLPFDVNDPAVDFTISTSLKWLCATPGAGILHVAPSLLEECHPELRGWFSQPDIFSWDLDKFAYAPDARRFDSGTPSIMAAVGSLPAMQWHAAQDRDAMIRHNHQLTAWMIDGLKELGLTITSPEDAGQRGGSVMVQLPPGRAPGAVLDSLRAAHIFADHRGPILRLSPGAVTTQHGVTRLLDGLHGVLKGALKG